MHRLPANFFINWILFVHLSNHNRDRQSPVQQKIISASDRRNANPSRLLKFTASLKSRRHDQFCTLLLKPAIVSSQIRRVSVVRHAQSISVFELFASICLGVQCSAQLTRVCDVRRLLCWQVFTGEECCVAPSRLLALKKGE